ncbi:MULTISPECIES: cytochrome c oxidase assembly protein [Methylosinus]|uniref:Cytochrome c oxidase assembly protein CtaG n=1 Tax=Methylosinus trichosporium (strain ATCC 35070 / NCIMB 11131 / UNIQEM 75 / OB3b) TaxID=595536 RepID=A0A2D2CZN4_METT3|nr:MULTISPECIES: cytochrome c oxidase assembly protein [Methylosinus]ATQ68175.1 cytochrome c oxidase assembly protein [Methylosinus trichosporium OB3b]OBS53440.1 cytochrome c oxidase assembly protein [Methylosinus sp. 3S-1]
MSENLPQDGEKGASRHGRSAGALVLGSLVMLALSFASVPLYRAFCAATGFGGTTQVAKVAPMKAGERRLAVRFDSNVARDLPWSFAPETSRIVARTGETTTVYYKVVNLSDHETTGVAAYNVSPDQAGAYFNKLACFCFSEQKLGPHEAAEWPVVFFLDPALESDETMDRVEEVTLSYTFFPSKAAPKAASAAGARPRS